MKHFACLNAAVFAVSTAFAVPAVADEDRAAAWRGFNAHFEACYSVHGYSPDMTQDLGDHELGRTERDWRACAYQGVEKFLIPGADNPEKFTQLIATDKDLTDKIESGEITRQQREEKIKAMVADIKAAEVDAIAAAGPRAAAEKDEPQQTDPEFTRRMVDSMRGLGRH